MIFFFSSQLQPSWRTVRVIQDKFLQKSHIQSAGVPVADSLAVEESTPEALQTIGQKFGYPFMLKSRTEAYDGRGNFVVKSADSIPAALSALHNRPLYAERWAPFVKELAVMVVRTKSGACFSYPTVETVHENNICKLVYAPARVPEGVRERARAMAEQAVGSFWGAGVFGVEMFLLEDGSLLLNELAPRPHNSGHYTIEACATSQYEAHIRAITDLPLEKHTTQLSTPTTASIMLNLLGPSYTTIAREALKTPGATIHLYGKGEAKVGRKMGHLTVVAGSMSEAERRIAPLIALSEPDSPAPTPSSTALEPKESPLVAIIMGSDSDLPTMTPAAKILRDFRIPFELTIVSAHRTPHRMTTYAETAGSRGIKVIIAGAGGAAHLPGMTASESGSVPVIGVPVKGSVLDGMDSLLSIVQMPRGIPVETMGIGNATNAGLAAVRQLAQHDTEMGRRLRGEYEAYVAGLEREVEKKVTKLEEVGWENYVYKK